jgi:hypothetical protein
VVADGEWVTDEIEVTVSGFWNTQHSLQAGPDLIGELTLPGFRRKGLLRLSDGRELTVEHTSFWKGTHEMREGGVLLGTARTRGVFKRQVDVGFGERQYVLQPGSVWKRNWLLVDLEGTVLLEMRPRGAFRRGAFVAVLAEVGIDLLAFAYYLVHKSWEAESAAVATTVHAA